MTDIAKIAAEKLEELAARVEAATGPDRELDAEIALAVGIVKEREGNTFFGHRDYSCMVLERGYYDHDGSAPELPHLTASIDAAMTLVPEGWDWQYSSYTGTAYVHQGDRTTFGHTKVGALALCAAALRAKAHILRNPTHV